MPAVTEPPGELMYKIDVLRRFLGLQIKHLRDDQVGHVVVNRRADEHDAVLQQPRVNVVTAFAAPGLFNDHRNQDLRFFHKLFF